MDRLVEELDGEVRVLDLHVAADQGQEEPGRVTVLVQKMALQPTRNVLSSIRTL